MVYVVNHFINGRSVHAPQQEKQAIYNPALGEVIAEVSFADQELCNQAVTAAKKAWPSWAETTAVKRAKVFFEFRELIDKDQKLIELITEQHGKNTADARGSIERGKEVIDFYCGLISQMKGSYTKDVSRGIDCQTVSEPLGVFAGVSPFNFPVMVPIWMLIPAIACGNCFILKPSEQDPSATLRLFELLTEAGLPDGVANCLQGNKETVNHLLKHPDIKGFTAVASTPVAEYIYKEATASGKRAHTFGGAKNHCVVMPDADLSFAAPAIVGAAYGSAGERCMALSVVVAVGDETADRLLTELTPLIKAIKVDAGSNAQCDMGPLISKTHKERVISAINKGVEEGAKLLIDGRQFKHPEFPQGFFMGPSLFDEVTENMSVYQQEIFGPVLVILRVKNLDEAIALVNRNPYGNGTAIFTRDGFSARKYSQEVEVGMVGVNVPIPVPLVTHPFGGWKKSSFGDTNMHALESIHFYTRRKTITSRWPATELVSNNFAMPVND